MLPPKIAVRAATPIPLIPGPIIIPTRSGKAEPVVTEIHTAHPNHKRPAPKKASRKLAPTPFLK